MMRLLKSLFLIVVVTLCSNIFVYASDDMKLSEMDYLKKIDLIYMSLKNEMIPTEKTGDLDVDFLNQTLAHYRGLIALAKNNLQYGERQELKEDVNGIIQQLKHNIKQIGKLQKKLNENPVFDENKEATYLSTYEPLYQQVLIELKSEGEQPTQLIGESVDADFLGRLSKQCDIANQFMNHVLGYTTNEDVIQLANEFMKTQTELKTQLESLIKKLEQ